MPAVNCGESGDGTFSLQTALNILSSASVARINLTLLWYVTDKLLYSGKHEHGTQNICDTENKL